jgi:hypothetical protein
MSISMSIAKVNFKNQLQYQLQKSIAKINIKNQYQKQFSKVNININYNIKNIQISYLYR